MDISEILAFRKFPISYSKHLQYKQIRSKWISNSPAWEAVVRTYIFFPLHIIQVAGGIPSGCVGLREVACGIPSGCAFYSTHYANYTNWLLLLL